MATIVHDCVIDWPNGKGETPCSTEYMLTLTARDLIYKAGASEWTLEDLSPEDYNRWMTLDDKLDQLQLAGHIGRSYRYEEA